MVDKYRIPTAIVGYSICSGTMLLLNKLAMHHIPVPSLVTVIQLVFAVVTIVVLQSMQMIPKDPLEWPKVKAYSIYMAAFVLGVYCNMRALENSNVETVIIFRSCTPLLVSLCDWLFLGRELPSRRSLAALLTIGLGAYGYVQADAQFKLEGASAYSWAALYFFAICFEMTYGKNITSGVRFNSMWGPTLYTNLLSVVPMFLLGYGLGDFDQFGSEDKVWSWSFPAITMLLASSIVGTLIGYTSWSCRSLVSATSFTLIGVINKFLTILLNVFIWDKHASPLGIAALVLCLLGGTAYKQSPMRVDKRDVSKEKEIESVALMVPVEDTEADTQK